MKVQIEVDMTPEEARRMMGLPDIAPLQEKMQEEMLARMKAAFEAGDPQAMARAWTVAGGTEAFEHFQKLMWDSARNIMGKG